MLILRVNIRVAYETCSHHKETQPDSGCGGTTNYNRVHWVRFLLTVAVRITDEQDDVVYQTFTSSGCLTPSHARGTLCVADGCWSSIVWTACLLPPTWTRRGWSRCGHHGTAVRCQREEDCQPSSAPDPSAMPLVDPAQTSLSSAAAGETTSANIGHTAGVQRVEHGVEWGGNTSNLIGLLIIIIEFINCVLITRQLNLQIYN